MSQQGSLPGFDAATPTDRLFLAVFPDAEHAAKLDALAGAHRPGGRPVDADRLHATLFHLGDYTELPPALIAQASDALAQLIAGPFSIRFDQVGSFGKALVFKADEGNEALHGLHRQLTTHLRTAGLGSHTRDAFTPHMTLTYNYATVPFRSINAVTWPVREVVLIHSLLGKTRHIRLASKALQNPA